MARRAWLERHLWKPLLDQLRQGVAPEKLAWSVALGIAFGCFPIFGVTTLLCIVFGVALGLNHPAIQVFNHLCAPLQLALMLPFIRLGDRLLGLGPAAHVHVSLLHAMLAWCIVAPPAACLIRSAVLPGLRSLSRSGVPQGFPK